MVAAGKAMLWQAGHSDTEGQALAHTIHTLFQACIASIILLVIWVVSLLSPPMFNPWSADLETT